MHWFPARHWYSSARHGADGSDVAEESSARLHCCAGHWENMGRPRQPLVSSSGPLSFVPKDSRKATVAGRPVCFMFIEYLGYSRQLVSSVLSPQSSSPSQRQIFMAHLPFPHWNSFGSHGSGFTVKRAKNMKVYAYVHPSTHARRRSPLPPPRHTHRSLTAVGLIAPVGTVVVSITEVVARDALPVLTRRLVASAPPGHHRTLRRPD